MIRREETKAQAGLIVLSPCSGKRSQGGQRCAASVLVMCLSCWTQPELTAKSWALHSAKALGRSADGGSCRLGLKTASELLTPHDSRQRRWLHSTTHIINTMKSPALVNKMHHVSTSDFWLFLNPFNITRTCLQCS